MRQPPSECGVIVHESSSSSGCYHTLCPQTFRRRSREREQTGQAFTHKKHKHAPEQESLTTHEARRFTQFIVQVTRQGTWDMVKGPSLCNNISALSLSMRQHLRQGVEATDLKENSRAPDA